MRVDCIISKCHNIQYIYCIVYTYYERGIRMAKLRVQPRFFSWPDIYVDSFFSSPTTYCVWRSWPRNVAAIADQFPLPLTLIFAPLSLTLIYRSYLWGRKVCGLVWGVKCRLGEKGRRCIAKIGTFVVCVVCTCVHYYIWLKYYLHVCESRQHQEL